MCAATTERLAKQATDQATLRATRAEAARDQAVREMEERGEIKSDWRAAAKKPLPSGRDPDDAMDEIDRLTTELPKPRR